MCLWVLKCKLHEGRPYLGAALGTQEFKESFVTQKVNQWVTEIELLSNIAKSQPHAAHAAFTHGMTSKWTYLCRTMPDIDQLLLPLEKAIRTKLLPALTGRTPPNDLVRDLLALPARLGGMAIPSPTQDAQQQYLNSCDITEVLTNAIVNQTFTYPDCIIDAQLQAKAKAHKSKQQRITNESELLKQSLPPSLTKAMDLAQEPGASSWLTSLPIDGFGFACTKVHSMMPSPFDTTGILYTRHQDVTVVPNSQ